jgi:hypothetical protein
VYLIQPTSAAQRRPFEPPDEQNRTTARRRSSAELASASRRASNRPTTRREIAPTTTLIRRAQARRRSRLPELVTRHQQRAWRVARNLVPHRRGRAGPRRQEAVPAASSRAWPRFDLRHAFTTWLYRIVTQPRHRPLLPPPSGDEHRAATRTTKPLRHRRHARRAPPTRWSRASCRPKCRATLSGLAPHFQSGARPARDGRPARATRSRRSWGATHVTVRWRLHRGRKLFQEDVGTPRASARNGRGSPGGGVES